MARSPRFTLYLVGTAVVGLVFMALLGSWFRPGLATVPREYSGEEVGTALEVREAELPAEPVRVQREVDYSAGAAAEWFPKQEAPILADLVAAGELPPVAERVGSEPVVMAGVDGPGEYGGTWTRVASSPSDVAVISWRLSAATLFRWSPTGYPIVPHVAKGYEVSEDQREWTIFLRQGMKWSDGHPFTANDFRYWWEQEVGYFQAGDVPRWLRSRGEPGRMEVVDDYTVRFIYPHPRVTFLEDMASPSGSPFSPGHYLSRYHPATGDPAAIAAAKASKGIENDRALYSSLKQWNNVDLPQLWPWIYRSHRSSPPQTFVRNPYYFAVDEQGRQLPYVDRVLFQEKSLALIPLAAAGGEMAMQTRHIQFRDYTLLMENRDKGGYQIDHWFPATRSVWTIFPNLNRRVDPAVPATALKSALLNDKAFRQALSLAINRERIISAEYNGVGRPAQIEPGPSSDFHHPELGASFVDYDPEEANRLLDSAGLTGRDSEGMRTFPDGSRMTWYLDFTDFTGEGPAQFVVDDWRKVGIRAIQRARSRPLFSSELATLRHDFTIWSGESEFAPLVQPRSFVPINRESFFAPGYGAWFQDGGLFKAEDGGQVRGLEPPNDSPARVAMELLDQALSQTDAERRQELMREIFAINAEEVWSISITTPPPQLVVVKDGFENVPEVAVFGAVFNTPGNAGMETYFWEDAYDSPGAVEAMRASIVTPQRESDTVLPAGVVAVEQGIDPGKVISRLIMVVLVLGLIFLAVRHPFIGRRFLILVPTLLIISIAGFAIIQLPPGSYVETKILELRMTGDEAAIREVQELVERFHLEDPIWQQYLRWMGVYWFFGFDKGDTGLLQGNMGRSMETGGSVNMLVGERVLLTFVVSFGTVLFTWITALPIGIYSAVRQYSVWDYVFTLIGFIGMCVPNFLLAILLMYWSSEYLGITVTGLFSIEYATTPEWSWGKFVDLLKHIWVPVVIIGTAGTAGMIRVMRGNLLDELKKPYVTTARAKGVRPMKLLWKYPVRLALNPFISGVGAIFPTLVSGGAIVAIVLSLPMVGPVLLSALMTQDLYLAASMLMMFSLLGVIGTLVSDLLLLWVDPRIRMEGGSK